MALAEGLCALQQSGMETLARGQRGEGGEPMLTWGWHARKFWGLQIGLPPPPAPGTHCARREARQPYMDGVYMLPLREERSREGLVFWLKISWLAAWKAFSTSLLV